MTSAWTTVYEYERVWHYGNDKAWVTVVVLAWHETSATVLKCSKDGEAETGETPYLVKTHVLRLGLPA